MWMCYGEKMDPIVFGEGQRSSGVTKGKKAKFPKNSQEFYMGSAEVKLQISQEFPKLNRNTKLYFSNILR
ncbi:hypothetical protein HOLleu_05994 [Holothuria leucospilota]|uniref:Uncharacterized protein n=1 Tax=Holothuria leucospilota TaxID=206669 RepID=A0A9Q1CLH4_HOLLE|nr:hypothetical protein HOLleu_05994 [Holothuria leucospilota]